MRGRQASLSGALIAALLACSAPSAPEPHKALPDLGVMGTIPVFWGEAASLGAVVAGEAEPHWAKSVLERNYRIVPLDTLDPVSLAGVELLLLAQPRALGAAENVALDAWVRRGGRLVMLADPAMTGDSRYPIGDKRRPQDVTLMSPILAHWGLALEFDESQQEGYREIEAVSGSLPVNLAGRFVNSGAVRLCRLEAGGIIARCTIGRGRAIVVADAAVLDAQVPQPGAGAAVERLVVTAYSGAGD